MSLPGNVQKILIIQTAFLGDVVLATVLIEKLKKQYPNAQIDFLLRKGNESLLRGHPRLRQVLIWDKRKDKYRNARKIIGQIRRERYDVLFTLQRFASGGLFTLFSGARHTRGFRKNPLSFAFSQAIAHQFGEGIHEVDRNIQLLEGFSDSERIRPKLYPQEADYQAVEKFKRLPYLCLAPASVWHTKQFPASQWEKFIREIPQDYVIYLLGSPSDQELCASIRQNSDPDRVSNLAGQLGLLASAALMEHAQMNFVNDSAPMHLASAMNAPVCAIFCSTIPEFGFGPLSETRYIVEVKESLACRPCGLHGKRACPEGHFRCALDIDIRQLLDCIPPLPTSRPQ